jgi:hypothetical protein
LRHWKPPFIIRSIYDDDKILIMEMYNNMCEIIIKIWKWYLEASMRRETDKTMATWKWTERQNMIDETLERYIGRISSNSWDTESHHSLSDQFMMMTKSHFERSCYCRLTVTRRVARVNQDLCTWGYPYFRVAKY